MFWKLEIIAFIVFFIASAFVFASGCMDIKSPEVQRLDLDAGAYTANKLFVEPHGPIPDEHIQRTEYIIMEEMRFDVTLADIHQ